MSTNRLNSKAVQTIMLDLRYGSRYWLLQLEEGLCLIFRLSRATRLTIALCSFSDEGFIVEPLLL